MARLTPDEIDALIGDCTFHEPKARTIHEIARRAVAEHGGVLPRDREALLALKGVGPKCCNLVLGIAGGEHISVDIHVHRIVNRWGYVQAKRPEKTMLALQAVLPRRYWVEINALLVPFGKQVCTGTSPKCSKCPVLQMCPQVGVTRHR
jgi:endonuclease-3